MAIYQGQITDYTLVVNSPNISVNYKSYITMRGAFGTVIVYFVPEGGQLGNNAKRAGQNLFDVYFWMSSWAHIVDMLRNESPVTLFYNDSYNTLQLTTGSEPIGEGE